MRYYTIRLMKICRLIFIAEEYYLVAGTPERHHNYLQCIAPALYT